MYEIYLATNLVNGKEYVGQTCLGWRNRWTGHLCDALTKHAETPFHRAIRKHGKESFVGTVLEMHQEHAAANEAEQRLIVDRRTQDPKIGYNIRDGGTHGRWSDAEIARIRQGTIDAMVDPNVRKKCSDVDVLELKKDVRQWN